MTQSAPQVADRLMSLVRSNFAADAFLDAVYHADLMEEETIEDLREMSRGNEEQREAFYKSDMYQFFASIAFVRPAGCPKATRKNKCWRRSNSVQNRSKSIPN